MAAGGNGATGTELDEAESLRRLKEVKHIVVLMMENRSFDQMLGFLDKHGRVEGVRGLRGGEVNYDEQGTPYESFEWGEQETSFHPPEDRSGKLLDPGHGPKEVAEQLEPFHGESPGGFVKNYVGRTKGGKEVKIPPEYRRLPMGYYSERHLPVYDLLARQYGVCDGWHCSVPGDTWPNRLYAMAGESRPSVLKKPGLLQKVLQFLRPIPGLGELYNAPLFAVEAFTRQLRLDQWRWYSFDPATLRVADAAYRDFRKLNRDNFTFFDRKRMSPVVKFIEQKIVDLHDCFLDDASKEGDLRRVSWIDPNFVDLKVLDANSNDDHPPSDVHAGQALVLETYEALVKSAGWEDTLLVIVYDEHGGFYDHVPPPPVRPGDPSKFKTLGVRVPALVVGPRVKNEVCHTTFEHTTLISTIFHCLFEDPGPVLAKMPWRVRHAPHLGELLASEPRPEACDRERIAEEIEAARVQLDETRREVRKARRANVGRPSDHYDGGVGTMQELYDWQQQFMGAALRLRAEGLPPGQP